MQDIEIYVDQDGALKRIGGNKGLYQRLLQTFLNDSLMDTLVEEFERGDTQAAAKSAHALKGASANMSFIKLSDTLKLLETGLKNGICDKDAFNACLDAFDKTKKAVNEILEY